MVREFVTHPGNVAPLDFRVRFPLFDWQVFGGFANDFNAFHDGPAHDFIGYQRYQVG